MLCMHIMDISGIVHIVLVLCIYVYTADIVYINYTRVPAAVLPVVPEQGESVATDHRRKNLSVLKKFGKK